MKRFVIILTLALAATAQGNAQNYMQHLKEKNNGQGNVTVTQSKEIDELVNNANTLSARRQRQQKSTGRKTAADIR